MAYLCSADPFATANRFGRGQRGVLRCEAARDYESIPSFNFITDIFFASKNWKDIGGLLPAAKVAAKYVVSTIVQNPEQIP